MIQPHWQSPIDPTPVTAELYLGDALVSLKELKAKRPEPFVHSVITSIPYARKFTYPRKDGSPVAGVIGLEHSMGDYLRIIRRIMTEALDLTVPGGALFLNVGETWNNLSAARGHGREFKEETFSGSGNRLDLWTGWDEKEALGIPEKILAITRAAGWLHRDTLIWVKPSGRPVNSDRPAAAWEPILYFRKPTGQRRYYADYWDGQYLKTNVIQETPACHAVHPCPFPPGLVKRLILASCPEGGWTLDPFAGIGTVASKSLELSRNSIGIDLNPDYLDIARAECQREIDLLTYHPSLFNLGAI